MRIQRFTKIYIGRSKKQQIIYEETIYTLEAASKNCTYTLKAEQIRTLIRA